MTAAKETAFEVAKLVALIFVLGTVGGLIPVPIARGLAAVTLYWLILKIAASHRMRKKTDQLIDTGDPHFPMKLSLIHI